MKKSIALVLTLGSLFAGSLTHAASITGKVTRPDGVTPVANAYVDLYKYNAAEASYDYDGATVTNASGLYTVTPSGAAATHLGSYLVTFESKLLRLPKRPF